MSRIHILLALLAPLVTACASREEVTPPSAPEPAAIPEATSTPEPAASPVEVVAPKAPTLLEPPVEPAAPAPPTLDPALFERVVVIGASASEGSLVGLDLGEEEFRFARIIEEAVLTNSSIAYDGADLFLFLNAEGTAATTVPPALATAPTLVVAPDFLFWFFYGPARSLEHRYERLETGLDWLEKFSCPVLVGDIPDMRGAEGGMIPVRSFPPAESFARANERIAAWAAEDVDRVLVPLDQHKRDLDSGQAFDVHGFTWDPDEQGDLLLADELHPNLEGSAVLAVMMLGCLAEAQGVVRDGVVMTDPELLAEAVDDRLREQ